MEMNPPSGAPSFTAAARRRIGLGVAVEIVAAVAIAAMLNYLGTRHFRRFDLAESTHYPLSPLTLQTLRALTNQVKVIVLLDPHDPASLFSPVSALLREYSLKAPELTVEYVDYLRDPAKAQFLKGQYHLPDSADKDLIIFDAMGRSRLIYERELSDYDFSGPLSGKSKEVKRTHFKGELFFTSALINVLDAKPHRVYFLQGHREHKPLDEIQEEGYGKFTALLKSKGITLEPLVLQGPAEIPSDCEALIIAGPREQLPEPELEKLQKFLKEGGKLFLLFGYFSPAAGWQGLLAGWGVDVGNNVVRDLQHTLSGWDLLTDHFGDHPIVKPIFDGQIHLNLPRAVEKRPLPRSDSAKVSELAFTSAKGELIIETRNGMPAPSPRDRHGMIPLGLAVEKGGLEGVSAQRGSTRIVVMGESLFLGNQGIESSYNRDFASLAINWLLDRPWMLEIGPRPIHEYRLSLTRGQLAALRWILIGAVPAGALLLGGFVWARRRL